MKKYFFVMVFLIVTSLAFSQTPLTVAVDFTATTTGGEQFNLFNVLAGGQYVCIDFFFTT